MDVIVNWPMTILAPKSQNLEWLIFRRFKITHLKTKDTIEDPPFQNNMTTHQTSSSPRSQLFSSLFPIQQDYSGQGTFSNTPQHIFSHLENNSPSPAMTGLEANTNEDIIDTKQSSSRDCTSNSGDDGSLAPFFPSSSSGRSRLPTTEPPSNGTSINDCHFVDEPSESLLLRHMLQQQEREQQQQRVQEQQQLRHQMQNEQQRRRQLVARQQPPNMVNRNPYNFVEQEFNERFQTIEGATFTPQVEKEFQEQLQYENLSVNNNELHAPKDITTTHGAPLGCRENHITRVPLNNLHRNEEVEEQAPDKQTYVVDPVFPTNTDQPPGNSPAQIIPLHHVGPSSKQQQAGLSGEPKPIKEKQKPQPASPSDVIPKVRTSNFIGVHWHRGAKKWVAQISIDSKRTHLGYFATEVEAAKRYDIKARELKRPVNQYDSLGKKDCVVVGATAEYTKGPYNKRPKVPNSNKTRIRHDEMSNYSHPHVRHHSNRSPPSPPPPPQQQEVYPVYHQSQCEQFGDSNDGNDSYYSVSDQQCDMVDKEVQTIPAFTMMSVSKTKRKGHQAPLQQPPPLPAPRGNYKDYGNSNFGMGSLMDLAETASTRAFAVPAYMPPQKDKIVFV